MTAITRAKLRRELDEIANSVFSIGTELSYANAWLFEHHPKLHREWKNEEAGSSFKPTIGQFNNWLSRRNPEVFAMYGLVRSTRELNS